jgi:hypothetical protein
VPLGEVPITGEEEIKLDLYGGTVQVGIFDERRTRIIRRGIVRNLVNDENKNLQAACAAFTFSGQFHPTLPELVTTAVSATSFGPTKSLIEMEYRPFRGHFPHSNPVEFANVRVSREAVRVYGTGHDENGDPLAVPFFRGMPVGWPEGVDKDPTKHTEANPPLAKRFARTIVRLIITTDLSFNVLETGVAAVVGTINQEPVTFTGGIPLPGNYPPFHVLLGGPDIRVIRSAIGINLYRTQYVLSVMQGGWYEQVLLPFQQGVGWDYTEQLIHPVSLWPQLPIA